MSSSQQATKDSAVSFCFPPDPLQVTDSIGQRVMEKAKQVLEISFNQYSMAQRMSDTVGDFEKYKAARKVREATVSLTEQERQSLCGTNAAEPRGVQMAMQATSELENQLKALRETPDPDGASEQLTPSAPVSEDALAYDQVRSRTVALLELRGRYTDLSELGSQLEGAAMQTDSKTADGLARQAHLSGMISLTLQKMRTAREQLQASDTSRRAPATELDWELIPIKYQATAGISVPAGSGAADHKAEVSVAAVHRYTGVLPLMLEVWNQAVTGADVFHQEAEKLENSILRLHVKHLRSLYATIHGKALGKATDDDIATDSLKFARHPDSDQFREHSHLQHGVSSAITDPPWLISGLKDLANCSGLRY